VGARGSDAYGEEFPENPARIRGRQKIASRHLGAISATEKENSSVTRRNITDGNQSRPEAGLTSLDDDETAGKPKTDLEVEAASVKRDNEGMIGGASQLGLVQCPVQFKTGSDGCGRPQLRALQC
jgi:hypothetical protein